MSQKTFRTLIAAAAVFIFATADSFAQQAVDQYGFGNRAFLIQSAVEGGKTAKGLWDIPGTPQKTDGNLKGTNWLHMQLWEREKGDPEDRVFRFRPAGGTSAGRYYIHVGRNSTWAVNGIQSTASIEARTMGDNFELKYIGNGKWKIYYKPGIIVGMMGSFTKNGTKLALMKDHNRPTGEWMLFDAATNQSFIPASTGSDTSSFKGTLAAAIASKQPGTQYFEYADGTKFNSENANGELQTYLNSKETADQWGSILNISQSVGRNKDTEARRSMTKALSEVQIKKAGNFAENLLKGQIVKQFNDLAAGEKDPVVKANITTIAGKIK